ncbi:MAG TPA: hypothetical protein VGN12_03615 [Pirellulales bacterium]|jgi:hypothetical protein
MNPTAPSERTARRAEHERFRFRPMIPELPSSWSILCVSMEKINEI